ncbi:MAG: ABC-F family ATP-binding cassette domain-containing protein, partial [Kofleriaceae bacterium]|nr:ABC-F family ATP-binding cassette domain-containing protein [Kofleriaceae bacterium]
AGDVVLAPEVRVAVARDARVHVAGANGAGKSTLLAALVAAAELPAERLLWLPQEVSAADGAALVATVARLPAAERGRLGQTAALLGLDPSRALASSSPSPGEVRKLAIALGLARQAWLVVLDEPTNHLDLPAIERLEDALRRYPGALLLASHDARFAAALTTSTWQVGGGEVIVATR